MAENLSNTNRGPKFVQQVGIAAPLLMDNVNTDVIAPIGKPPVPGVTAETRAFEPIRFFSDGTEKSDFILNQEAYRKASIILAGKNFGTGSSRSSAVTRPMDGGINVVIAESFGPLFYDNSIRYGLLAVSLEEEKILYIAQWSRDNPGKSIVVDLEREVIEIPGDTTFDFRIEPRVRQKLLNAYTPLQEVLQHKRAITVFQQSYKQSKPWIYGE